MIRKLIKLGDPVLRKPARSLTAPGASAHQGLFADMFDTLEAAGGVGIAAPQIGESLSAAIVAPHPNERYPQAPSAAPLTLINPEVLWVSQTEEKDWEGCLSIPGVRGLVSRPTQIKVRYRDAQTGKTVIRKFSGFPARVFLHEWDHLQGRVFLDRVENEVDLAGEEAYKRILTGRREKNV